MPPPPPLIKVYRCHMCEESFSAMGLLIEHQSAHAGQGLLFCGKCEGLFSCRDQLEQHQCTSCTYICTCGNGFPQYPALLEHMRSHDEGLPPGYPDPADQARRADTTSSHTLVADLVKQRQQEKGRGGGGGGGGARTGAPAGFGEMVDLKLRFLPVVSIRRQEEEESVRGHKCGICGWTFVILDLLIEHHTSHSADAVYGCRRCRRAVSSSVLLERHACAPRDLLGNGGSFRFDGVAVMQGQGQGQVPLGYVGDVWHRCSMCPMVYRRRADLEKHQVSHLDSKPFRCHRCHRFYLREYSLRKHRCPVSDSDARQGPGKRQGTGSLPVGFNHRVEQTVFIYKRSECAGPGGLGHGVKKVRNQVEVTFRETQNLTQPQPLSLTQFQPQPLPPLQPQPEPRPLLLIQSPLQSRLLPQTLPHLQPQLWSQPLSHFQTQAQLQYQRQSPLLHPSQTSKALPADRPSQSADWHKDRGPGCVQAKGPSWLDSKAQLLTHLSPEPEPSLPLEDEFVFRSARGTRTYQRRDCSAGVARPFVMPESEQSSSEVGAGGRLAEEEEERTEPPPPLAKRKLELQFSDEEDDDCVIIEPNQQNNKEEEGRRRRRRRVEEEHEPQNPPALPASRDCNGTDSRETNPPAGSRDQEVLPRRRS